MNKLSILIPVFNEEATVIQLLRQVLKAKLPRGTIREIVVIDDGSRDNSKKLISKFIKSHRSIQFVEHKVNLGKGAAIKSGLKHATGDLVLIQDADLEYSPNDYQKLLLPIIDGETEVVYGTRLKKLPLHISGRKRTPLVSHYFGNAFLTFITNLLYGSHLTDMETCYKVFTKKALRGITIDSRRFEFEPEITAKLLRKNIKILEIPIKVKPRGYDEGKKISWRDGFIALSTLLKYRFS